MADGEAYDLAATPRTNLGKATDLLGQVFANASASEQGTLTVWFANGWQLRVPAHGEQLAWVLALLGHGRLAAKSGGGLSVTG